MENKKKKRYGIIAALLLLVLAAGVGTYAWLTATQSLENVFTVGSFGPTDKKPDPTDPEKPGDQTNDAKPTCSRPSGLKTPRSFLAPPPTRTPTLASRRVPTTPTCSSM